MKLNQFGFHSSLLNGVKSYLAGRKRFGKISGWTSHSFVVKSGIPQGSHRGPLLFLIFVNDVVELFKHSKRLMFADDLKLFKSV